MAIYKYEKRYPSSPYRPVGYDGSGGYFVKLFGRDLLGFVVKCSSDKWQAYNQDQTEIGPLQTTRYGASEILYDNWIAK